MPRSLPLAAHPPPPPAVGRGEVAITFIGHSTFLIRTASAVILTDPVFTSHAGPFGCMGPRRVRRPAVAPSSLPPIDLVLVSHNHYDHLQPSSLRLFADRATYVTPLGVASQLRVPPKGGNDKSETRQPSCSERWNVLELDWWESATTRGAEITCVPAQHFSARTAWDRNQTLWCGFIVRVDGATIYFGGDSGYSPQFGEIGARFPSIDVALLPIGAYEPRWFMSPVHMNPEEAVRAHLDVKARASIGMHFGTFQLTDEGIDEPLRALERARETYGVRPDAFGVLDFGETKILGK